MNTLELKGVILNKIAQLEDPQMLQEVLDILESMLIFPDADSDGWSDLPPEAQQELLLAIKESESDDPSLFVSNEEVFKKYEKWLK